jgi:hypothetical protein
MFETNEISFSFDSGELGACFNKNCKIFIRLDIEKVTSIDENILRSIILGIIGK